MVDLRANPFFLQDEDVEWVESTLSSMNLRQKIGQLFCPVGQTKDTGILNEMLERIQPGGIMYRPDEGAANQEVHRYLQQNSNIPLLIAANLEAGGNGIASDGTFFGRPMQIAAADSVDHAYRLGVVCGREGAAVGCNWSFAPVVDIDVNFRNPITNTRTYGSDPERVLAMSRAYMQGIQESDMAVSIKHFPGDGVDERDQHLHISINSMTVEEWDNTFGKVYQGMIANGAKTVMIGHIMLPEYSRALLPGIDDRELKPATLAPELLQTLLREKLGFNGMIVTDATNMGGFTMAEKRELAVPMAIAAGCDMFLFNKNIDEDYQFMLSGVERGLLKLERVDEAVTRILALKASLGLHRKQAAGTLVPSPEALSVLRCEEHEQWARECADESVTLVKDTQGLLPINPQEHQRILLFLLTGDVSNYGSQQSHALFIERLQQEGFEVEIFDAATAAEERSAPIQSYLDKFDFVLYYACIETASNQTVVRINWAPPMGLDMPFLVQELPTAFVSMGNPYHLQDVPQMKTYINAYSSSRYVVDAVVDKLLGRSSFKGINPVDPYCGYWEAKL
ncbi:glycoside hydrolase family 3 protein [Paenibacillus fonticola]|uniref:glycoside hydrolase family 3 protein n=1 Tax=Paenibacillus fonticola TaxID=379896 RepID=UPI00036FB71F|nr:glycoside hydrolase family 3 N-terminal domain-containing protein [Paenibacillus fonticola]